MGQVVRPVFGLGALRALSQAISRSWLGSSMGRTFEGNRDMYETLGYKKQLLVADMRFRYRRGGIAKRIVEALPNATWRGGAELIEDDQDLENLTEFEQAFKDLNERLHIWSTLRRLDIMAGQAEYAIMVIGAPGNVDAPMPKKLDPDDIAYLQVYGQDEAEITKFITDEKDPRYGWPETYSIQRKTSGNLRSGMAIPPLKTVHWSRVLHCATDVVDNQVFGTPRLEAVWNDLDNLDKVLGGGSEAFWLRVHQGFHLNVDKDLEIDPDDATELMAQVDQLTHKMRRAIMTRGIELEALGSDVANFGPNAEALLNQIAGTTEIPKRILMGSERGELASSQDKTNWDERISDRRTEWAHPRVVHPFVEMLIERGALPKPEQWRTEWPERDYMSATEKATVATQWAGLNQAAGEPVVTADEIREKVLGMPALTEEQRAAEEEKVAAKEEAELAKKQVEAEIATKNQAKLKQTPPAVDPNKLIKPRAAAGLQDWAYGDRARVLRRHSHRAAERLLGKVRRSLGIALDKARGGIDLDAVRRALEAQDEEAALDALESAYGRELGDLPGLQRHLEAALAAAGESASLRAAMAVNQPRDEDGRWTGGGSVTKHELGAAVGGMWQATAEFSNGRAVEYGRQKDVTRGGFNGWAVTEYRPGAEPKTWKYSMNKPGDVRGKFMKKVEELIGEKPLEPRHLEAALAER